MFEGFAIVLGECVACKARISFNPVYVPSLRINGKREPLCPACHAKWNEIHRTSKGLPPIPLHPEAYTPCPAEELPA